jgi:hypothetical protein
MDVVARLRCKTLLVPAFHLTPAAPKGAVARERLDAARPLELRRPPVVDVHRFVSLLNARRLLRDVEHERRRESLK